MAIHLLSTSRIIILLTLALLIGLAPTNAAWSLDAGDLCFYAPFDGSLDAAYAAGEAKPKKVVGEYAFVPGMVGDAVVVGEPGKMLSYAVARNFPGSKGSISVWIKTIDWSAGDLKNHLILSIPERLKFYQASHSGGIHLEWLQSWGGSTYNYPDGPKADVWKHLVFTWGDGGVTLYQNGKFVSRFELTNRIYFPGAPTELPTWADDLLFDICDPSETSDGKNAAVLDELMLFNRPLDAVEVRRLYRGAKAASSESVARIASTKGKPDVDGVAKQDEWRGTAQFPDFVDMPFHHLSDRPVKLNLAYDEEALYVLVTSNSEESDSKSEGDCVELLLSSEREMEPYRFIIHMTGEKAQYQGGKTLSREIWQAAATTSPEGDTFEAAIPWASIGVNDPASWPYIGMNILRRWSSDYADSVSWVAGIVTEPRVLCRIIPGGDKPVFAMEGLGELNYAQLDLAGKIIGLPDATGKVQAEVRLQPSDLEEYWDPKTLPGTKSYTGERILLDKTLTLENGTAELAVTHSFSNNDIDSLLLILTDDSGDIIYQAHRPFVPQPPLTISLKTFPDNDRLEMTADVSGYRESTGDISAVLSLMSPSGETLESVIIGEFESRSRTVNLPLKPLPEGQVTVKGSLLKADTAVSEFVTSFEKLAAGPWYGSNLGKDDIVIPPFTPVKVDGQQVSVWGRTYVWNNSLFPVQVISGGEQLLTGPIEVFTGESPTGKANVAQVRVVERSDTKVVVEAVGEIAGVPVTASYLIEYDGMVLTTLQISPKDSTRLEGLALHIPYKPEQSTLYMISPGPLSGAVAETVNHDDAPMNGGRDLPFKNTVWFGNEERGMTWFTEHGKGWKLADNIHPLEVRSSKLATTLTVRFARSELQLDEPLSLTFGIHATPVKPMKDDWRFMRCGRDWLYRWYGVFTAANNDIANPFPSFKEHLEEKRKEVPLYVPYQMPVWINTRQPETAYYGEEWMFPPRNLIGNDEGDEERHIGVCLGSAWQDFMVHYAVKAYDDLVMDGYYLDGMVPDMRGCTNASHGHGWTDDAGRTYGTYTILANREFLKRLAVEFHKRDRPSLLFVHLSGCIEMPTFSFADMGWNGEQFATTATPARDYNKLLTLPYFRVQLLGEQFGVPQQWLLEYWPTTDENPIGPADIDTALGLALVHGVGDNIIASNFGYIENGNYARSVLNAQDTFGIREKDCRFLPYWNNQKHVTLEPADENLVCSIWTRPGKALVVINNSTEKDQEAVVRLYLSSLGLPDNLKATDLITQEPEKWEAGELRAQVKRSNWRLIVLEKAE